MTRTNAAVWITLLAIGAVGETAAFILAVIFGVSAFGQTDAAERSRVWATAGWWLLGAFAFTTVTFWSLVQLLRIVARQAPQSSSNQGET